MNHNFDHPFLVQAKALAAKRGITEAKAYESLARSEPALYESWRNSVGTETTTGATQQRIDNALIVHAKHVASGAVLVSAESFEQLARSNPNFYDSYRENLGR